jgi:hypothetical protein
LGWGLRKLCDRCSQNIFASFEQTSRCSRVPLQKLLLHKKFSAFLKADGLVPCSSEPASWPFPELDGSSPRHPIYSEILRNVSYHIDLLRRGTVTLLLNIVEGPTTVDCPTTYSAYSQLPSIYLQVVCCLWNTGEPSSADRHQRNTCTCFSNSNVCGSFTDMYFSLLRRRLKIAKNDYYIRHVRLSAMEQLGSHGTYIHEIWRFFEKSVQKIPVSLKSDKNNGYFIWKPINISHHISLSSS